MVFMEVQKVVSLASCIKTLEKQAIGLITEHYIVSFLSHPNMSGDCFASFFFESSLRGYHCYYKASLHSL